MPLPTIVIDGVKYEILRERDFVLTSREVSTLKNPVTRTDLWLKRPRGKRTYHAVRYENGTVSSVV